MNQDVLAGVIELSEAKRLKSLLSERGVYLRIASNPETCVSGKCATTVEIHIAQDQLPVLMSLLDAEREKLLAGHAVVPGLLESVYDPELKEASCPACGIIFPTTLTECPDCGLGFAP